MDSSESQLFIGQGSRSRIRVHGSGVLDLGHCHGMEKWTYLAGTLAGRSNPTLHPGGVFLALTSPPLTFTCFFFFCFFGLGLLPLIICSLSFLPSSYSSSALKCRVIKNVHSADSQSKWRSVIRSIKLNRIKDKWHTRY